VASSAEASAKTVEAAIAAAAAKLGVRADQIEVEVLKEPVPSTFGKVGEPATVRVTKRESPREPSAAATTGGAATATVTPPSGSVIVSSQDGRTGAAEGLAHRHPEVTDPEAVAADTELAADFVEGLLDVLDVDGDITTWVDDAGGHVDVEGSKLEFMVGREGETLSALQEVTRLAVLRQTHRWVRITVDVNGFKAQRRQELVALAKSIAERVAQTGGNEELEPMTSFERKIVHDVVSATSGVVSESIGEEPNRRVVIRSETGSS
jgi:spoIIIJ-associated protein